jgi:hypothetical protein
MAAIKATGCERIYRESLWRTLIRRTRRGSCALMFISNRLGFCSFSLVGRRSSADKGIPHFGDFFERRSKARCSPPSP